MGTGCSIYVEFGHPPSQEEANGMRDRLAARLFMLWASSANLEVQPLDDPLCLMMGYSGYSVDDTGTLYDDEERGIWERAIGCGYSIATGAIGWIHCGGRYWSKEYPEGPLPEHAIAMLTMLDHPMVKRCWYCPENYSSKPKALSKMDVHALIDDFISVGCRRPR